MSTDRDPPDPDERTAQLGRQWFAEVRQRVRDETTERKRQEARVDTDGADGSRLFDWLFRDSDTADGDAGGTGN